MEQQHSFDDISSTANPNWTKPVLLERQWGNLQLSHYWDVEILGQLIPVLDLRLLHDSNYWGTSSITNRLIPNPCTRVYKPIEDYLNSRDQGGVRNFFVNLERAWPRKWSTSTSTPRRWRGAVAAAAGEVHQLGLQGSGAGAVLGMRGDGTRDDRRRGGGITPP